MNKSARFTLWAALPVAAALVAGCAAVGPDYQRPEAPTPAQWRTVHEGVEKSVDTQWWHQFHDAELDALVHAALEHNKDLLVAAHRVEEYRARYQIFASATYPSVYLGGTTARERLSQDRHVPLQPNVSPTDNEIELGLKASWELDLWGRVRRSKEAALAQLLQSEEQQRAVLLTVVADTASGYIRLLELDRELQLLKDTLRSRSDTVRLYESKYKQGGISMLPLAQARAAYDEIASLIPQKEEQIGLLENALSLLAGRTPGPVRRGSTLETLAQPTVPQTLPSSLLQQRPDVRAAEQALISANAAIGVAKAEYYPKITLTGVLGFASDDLYTLTARTAQFGSIGGNLVFPLFDAGRIEGTVKQAEAVDKQALEQYLKTALVAFREADDAMLTYRKAHERLDVQNGRVKAEIEYSALAHKRYEGGGANYLEVLDAERSLYAAQAAQTQAQGDVNAALVALYRTMGGGWVNDASLLSAAVQPEPKPSTALQPAAGAGAKS
jgi:multidrug efflux system outer membrane protein